MGGQQRPLALAARARKSGRARTVKMGQPLFAKRVQPPSFGPVFHGPSRVRLDSAVRATFGQTQAKCCHRPLTASHAEIRRSLSSTERPAQMCPKLLRAPAPVVQSCFRGGSALVQCCSKMCICMRAKMTLASDLQLRLGVASEAFRKLLGAVGKQRYAYTYTHTHTQIHYVHNCKSTNTTTQTRM